MRRELKFRAYSEQDAIMYQPLSLRVIAQLGHDFSDNIKLMQYTGLKDKNGVEIYEGDVLKLSRCDEGRIYFDLFYSVSWDAPSFFIHTLHCLCNKERKRAVKEKRISETGSAIYYNGGLDIYSSRNLAVIGNIYEDSELLKVK